MIIDPPSDFSPLAEWTEFRSEMEALAASHPKDADVQAWLIVARTTEQKLNGAQA